MSGPDRTSQFVALFAAHDRGIYKHILMLLVDSTATQEVFQETSVALWRKFDEFQPGSNFLAWACRVAYFEVLNYRRERRRGRLRFDDDLMQTLAEERLDGEDLLQARREVLPGCMDKLPPADRELVERRYASEETILELARRTGRQANTLYKALERIRRALMTCIENALAETPRGERPNGKGPRS